MFFTNSSLDDLVRASIISTFALCLMHTPPLMILFVQCGIVSSLPHVLCTLLPWCSSFSTGGDHSSSSKILTNYLGQWLLLLLTIYNTWRGRETGPESTSKKGTACRAAKKADDNFKDSHYEHILNLNSRENLCGSRNLVYFRAQILTSRRHSLASLAGWCIAALVWQLLLHLAPQ
jgi:hypothetical protein